MNSIYSRYIPPKPKTQSTIPEKVEISSNQPAPTIITDASSTYKRYIPSKRNVSEIDDESLEASNLLLEKTEQRIETTNDSALPDTVESHESEKKSKKPKKHKKPKISNSDEPEPSDDDRHKDLLRKREKSLKKAVKIAAKKEEEDADKIESILDEPAQIHPLQPLPQPEPVPEPPQLSTFAALPSWLSSPIRIPPSATAEFTALGLKPEIASVLIQKGYPHALAIQSAALPLLLPTWHTRWHDVCISAETGSGKTLAYTLPLVKDISATLVPRLRGIVVVPARDLVRQVRDVAEICASAISSSDTRRIQIGISAGNAALTKAEKSIMQDDLVYDPIEYRRRVAAEDNKWENASNMSDNDDEEFILCTDEPICTLPDHINRPRPKIDLLICTPGRLVEHIKSTPGFTLEYLKWLVIDEADKLLDQSFQQWKEVVMSNLPSPGGKNEITKVICSASITRDVSLLADLKLRRPKLIELSGSESSTNVGEGVPMSNAALNIPATLIESAVKVENEDEKPLYLLHLLRKHIGLTTKNSSKHGEEDSGSDSASEADSIHSSSSSPHGILIFTKSNESAHRLSRLLTLMHPTLQPVLRTMTSTVPSSQRIKILTAFKAGSISVMVASDLIARGLDLPSLAHVVNYDVPTSLTAYVHRVGRTARAGKEGRAWTLYGHNQGRFFWNEIARSDSVRRGQKVARVNIEEDVFGEEERVQYNAALLQLGEEAGASNIQKTK